MNKHPNTTVGIIGFGSFGKFTAKMLKNYADILVFDAKSQLADEFTLGSFEAVCATDIVILAIPLSAYSSVLNKIKYYIKSSTLIVDVCSVKVLLEELFAQFLPDHQNILLTHPLFGPQSATGGLKGHKLIVTKQLGDKSRQVLQFCKTELGLQVDEMSADEHDRAMAAVHALTFFVARSLANINLNSGMFQTPSYKMIEDLIALDKTHSEELFKTVELGNPFAKEARLKFVEQAQRLNSVLVEETL